MVDTLQNAYIHAAETAAAKKIAKYSSLENSHPFYPVALETLGPMYNTRLEFMIDIGRKMSATTNDPVCLAETFTISEAAP